MTVRQLGAPPAEPDSRVVLLAGARDVSHAWAGDRRGAKVVVFFVWAMVRARIAEK